MKVTREIHETRCDRCERKVTASGGAFVLSVEGPKALSQEFRPSVEVIAEDEGGDEVDVLAVADLCRACKVSLLKWWARGKDDADEEQDAICGEREGKHVCQLVPDHAGPHADPDPELGRVHEWLEGEGEGETAPAKPPKGKGAKS